MQLPQEEFTDMSGQQAALRVLSLFHRHLQQYRSPIRYWPTIALVITAQLLSGCAGNPKYLYPIVDPLDQPHVDRYVVHAVMPNSPMSNAGIRPGDEIILVDGKTIDGQIKTHNAARTKKQSTSLSEETVKRWCSTCNADVVRIFGVTFLHLLIRTGG